MSPLLFIACFMFLAALLLVGVIYSRISWWIKAACIVVSLAFTLLFYHAHVDALGYPVGTTPPKLFEFLHGVVREPYPARQDAGAIYLWIIEPAYVTPRAIELPYSEETRKMVTQAKKRAQTERVFMGVAATEHGEQQKPSAGSAQNGVGGHGHGDNNVPYRVNPGAKLDFAPSPDTLPKKEHE